MREVFYAIMDCPKPVIAALSGPALGAGFALALSCDMIIADEDTFCAMPEVDVGLAGGVGIPAAPFHADHGAPPALDRTAHHHRPSSTGSASSTNCGQPAD